MVCSAEIIPLGTMTTSTLEGDMEHVENGSSGKRREKGRRTRRGKGSRARQSRAEDSASPLPSECCRAHKNEVEKEHGKKKTHVCNHSREKETLIENSLPRRTPLRTSALVLNVDAPKFEPGDRQAQTETKKSMSSGPSKEGDKKPEDFTAKERFKNRKMVAHRKDNRKSRASGKVLPKVQHSRKEGPHLAEIANKTEELDDNIASPPHCLLCAELMETISFGSCNHYVACGKCCLRLRMCYNRVDCPLCKIELKEIVIAPWRASLPEFSQYRKAGSNQAVLARGRKLGPGQVFVDRWQPSGRNSTKLLHELVGLTTLSCSVCDPKGRKPFEKPKVLKDHLSQKHNKYICMMCLREGRVFPMDLPLYSSSKELLEHHDKEHPKCEFCRTSFYDGDALFLHMKDKHFQCQICEPQPRGDYPWYPSIVSLQDHMQEEHFACDDPECIGCLVAFRTSEELKRHYITRHSSRMTRWNPSSGRQFVFDIRFDEARDSRDSSSRASNGRNSSTRNNQSNLRHPRDFELETEEGMAVIDDDLGLTSQFIERETNEVAMGTRVGYSQAVSGSNASEDHFPSLAAVAMAGSRSSQDEISQKAKLPPLVKQTVHCPCGRRVSHQVLEEGKEPRKLHCDAVCDIEKRRASLATAFGIENPDRHISIFDRRQAEWSGALLAAAKQNPKFIKNIERELELFVVDKTAKRRALSAFPRVHRAIVHGMAAQYGLATISSGQEPNRFVEMIKPPSSSPALPDRLLSHIAEVVSDSEISELLAAGEGHPIRFVDIVPACDITYYLRSWEGRYSVEWEGNSAAIVRFERKEDKMEALDVFGGGIRGIFLLDRQWKPRCSLRSSEGQQIGSSAKDSVWSSNKSEAESSSCLSDDMSSQRNKSSLWSSVASVNGCHTNASRHLNSQLDDQRTVQEHLPKGWTIISRQPRNS